MAPSEPVYLEVGRRRTFAGALGWPGWCRSGRDEASSLQALVDAGTRYAQALRGRQLGFRPPKDVDDLNVLERLSGSSTTDFGAPAVIPGEDARPVTAADLRRFETILRACWGALDDAAAAAHGIALRIGPRGGGRSLDAIVLHVLNAEAGYLGRLGARHRVEGSADRDAEAKAMREAILDVLGAAVRDGVPAAGPRGGKRWPPRYFVRRMAWHALDHAWEIEDRAAPAARLP